MKIGIIGAGNVASAIMGGSINYGKSNPSDFTVYDLFTEKASLCAKNYGVNTADSSDEIAKSCDAIIFAVKPKDFPGLLGSLDAVLKEKNPLLISVAAGLSLDYIESLLSYQPRLIRIMTNLNASIGEAMTAYCSNSLADDSDIEFIKTFSNSFGDGIALDESYFALFGVVAGCGPAFAYMFIDQFARAGVKIGLNKKLALQIAAQTVLGSAKTILESDEHPYELIDRVCTPGGTTIEGIVTLQEWDFGTAVIKAVESSLEKDRKLAKK